MISWQALIVSFLVSGSLAGDYDLGSDCQSFYESLNTLLLNYPKNYGFTFTKSSFLYNNPKFYLELPMRIGHEGCHAQITENEGNQDVTVVISGILSGKLEVRGGLVKLEDMNIIFTFKVDSINKSTANITEIAMNIDYISKVSLDEGYKTIDVTGTWAEVIASTITQDFNEYLKTSERPIVPLQVEMVLAMTEVFSYQTTMQYWIQQEFGYATGLIY